MPEDRRRRPARGTSKKRGRRGAATRTTIPAIPPAPPLSRQERHLRIALLAGALLFAVEAAIYVPEVFGGPPDTRPFAINSVAKDVLFAALTALAAVNLRRLSRLIGLVILGHVVILILLGASLISGDADSAFPPPRWLADLVPISEIDPDVRLLVWLVSCAVATAVLVWLYRRALKVRYDLRYLWAIEHEIVAALADAAFTDPAVPPVEVATAVDHYWASLDIGYKGRLRFALWIVGFAPLFHRKPPLPLMERGRREAFIRQHLLLDVSTRRLNGRIRTMVQSSIRFALQMVYSRYYNDERSHAAVGYERFSKRPGYPGDPPEHRPLRTIPAAAVGRRWRDEDVVVVGSGAGGAVVARELVRRGRRVLIVERGPHVERSEFVEDEAVMYSRLYSDGALQTSRDFTFQVLQGMCVGGTTVVNNAVSFRMPDDVLARWNAEFDAGLPPDEMARSFESVERAGARPAAGRAGGEPADGADQSRPVRSARAGVGEHRGVLRLRVLQHRLPLRQEAVDARRRAAGDADMGRRRTALAPGVRGRPRGAARLPGDRDTEPRQPGHRGALHPGPARRRAGGDRDLRRDGRGGRRRDPLEPPSHEQRDRRGGGGRRACAPTSAPT